MSTLNKDQLALLNGFNDIEELSAEEMHDIAGGYPYYVPVGQSCPYGTVARATYEVPQCGPGYTYVFQCPKIVYQVCVP